MGVVKINSHINTVISLEQQKLLLTSANFVPNLRLTMCILPSCDQSRFRSINRFIGCPLLVQITHWKETTSSKRSLCHLFGPHPRVTSVFRPAQMKHAGVIFNRNKPHRCENTFRHNLRNFSVCVCGCDSLSSIHSCPVNLSFFGRLFGDMITQTE